MTLTDLLADQHRLPRGPLAPLAALSLNRRNESAIRACVEALELCPADSVLDVGFGGALSLHLLLRERGQHRVCGVEPSVDMVRRAKRLLGPEVGSGRLVLRVGSVEAIPFPDGAFDAILTCQTVYFWPDVAAGLAELYRVLAPGGRCALALMPRGLQEHFGFAARGYNVVGHQELGQQLGASGFATVVLNAPPAAGGRWVVVATKAAEPAPAVSAEVGRSAPAPLS